MRLQVYTAAGNKKMELFRSTPFSRRQLLRAGAVAPVLVTPRLFAAQYDLVIRGGRVLDASQHLDRMADVAIQNGKIAAIRPHIASSEAAEMIDASGKLVTPGLIDIHAHVADKDLTPAQCLSAGVTSRLFSMPVRAALKTWMTW